MTSATLREYTLKDLAQMARKRGIQGWHSLRKDDLIRAIVKQERRSAQALAKKKAVAAKTAPQAGASGVKNGAKNGARKSSAGRAAARVSPVNRLDQVSKNGDGPGAGPKRMAVSEPHFKESGRRSPPSKASNNTGIMNEVKLINTDNQRSNGHPHDESCGNGGDIDSSPPVQVRIPPKKSPTPAKLSPVARKIQRAQQELEQLKNLSGTASPIAPPATNLSNKSSTIHDRSSASSESQLRDRVVLMVRDPYWLHVHWELSSRSIQRAQAAMAEYWHTAHPVIRLLEVSAKGTTTSSETFVRDVEIHGGVNNWYIDVLDPPKGYRVEIGYLASNGRFHGLARSNCVETPQPGVREALDHTWIDVAENCERIFALSGGYSAEGSTDELQEILEERLCRPVGAPLMARYGVGADLGFERDRGFTLEVDAEMIVSGSTKPGSHVTLGGEPIRLREDGTFSLRMPLPDRRQVLPITSSSRDGVMQQTVVLAVERNTKVMEAVTRDANE